MQISPEDVDHYFLLHRSLMFFVNRELRVLDQKVASVAAYSSLAPPPRLKVQEAFLEHIELIDAFADENPFRFDEADLEIVRSWKHFVTGTFYAYRPLRDYMVFLSSEEPVVAYGVLALFSPFERVIGPHLPRMIKTTLLPFKGRIVYDGLVTSYNVNFGPGIRRRLNNDYKEAKERFGIVTGLPFTPDDARLIEAKPKPKTKAKGGSKPAKAASSREGAQQAHDRIVALIDAFCRDHLDEEYAVLCRKLAGVLARKRPSPLARGKPESWAGAIVRVIGSANFLSDPSQPHHMRMTDIDERFGISEGTGSSKATAIRNLLGINPLDPQWTLPSQMGSNLLVWMIEINGLIADARHLPRPIQEQAFRKGLIPYIPADGPGGPAEN